MNCVALSRPCLLDAIISGLRIWSITGGLVTAVSFHSVSAPIPRLTNQSKESDRMDKPHVRTAATCLELLSKKNDA